VSGPDGVVSVDQTPIRGSPRSNPATYSGRLDPIRTAFAKANGVKPAPHRLAQPHAQDRMLREVVKRANVA
jgi:excinuclease UvrABC ATPase subunit